MAQRGWPHWKTVVYYFHFLREGGLCCHVEPHEKTPGLVRRQKGVRRKHSPLPLLCFLWERRVRTGEQLWIDLSNVGGFWTLGVVSDCLYPALGWFMREEYWLPPGIWARERKGFRVWVLGWLIYILHLMHPWELASPGKDSPSPLREVINARASRVQKIRKCN